MPEAFTPPPLPAVPDGMCLASDIQEYAENYARQVLEEYQRAAGAPVAWISAESLDRLRDGGNSTRGTVPVHSRRSHVSNTPLSVLPVVSNETPGAP